MPDATPTGSITGIITDPEHVVLPGVGVTLTAEVLDGQRSTISGAGGHFTFVMLPPGRYMLHAHFEGFEPVAQDGLHVQPGRETEVQVEMTPAS